ncbi:OprD family porin [Pseudomonas sp. CCC3.1]|uniref:OprD family porin n=1 Tax=Pseudomonas sp. CCC3.1 TaxID=3048607 RepID=UPI002AC97B76|nr:OprD family porin [Pseudomonas sp. CCC3.1]MEB0205415.1 OprD family porin [Pseudomonas sp. CCC3.1]WPX36083.1 OprD family porin [Pseudomonas sp. CCC3.1]
MRNSTTLDANKLALIGAGLLLSPLAQADFIADSNASLEMRNYYFNRDFRQSDSRDKAEEWAQGFLLRLESGYTEGTVGFGLDAVGMLGLKLDSGGGTGGTNLLLPHSDGGSHDSYSKLAVAAKVKISNSVLKVGDFTVKDPVVNTGDARLLLSTFRGALLTVKEIPDWNFNYGELSKLNYNESTDYQDLSASRIGGTSDRFRFGGFDYTVLPTLTASYRRGQLDGIYQQDYFGGLYVLPLGEGQRLKTDLRYAVSREDGNFQSLDNKSLGLMTTYTVGGHSFGAGYQKMTGSDPFPYINRADPYLVNFVMVNDFGNINEKSWQARYDFDFAAVGVPGLSFMTRYVHGDEVHTTATSNGKEWERNTDIAYVIQSGPLKNFGMKWRNATIRSTFGNDLDENRIVLTYNLPLW